MRGPQDSLSRLRWRTPRLLSLSLRATLVLTSLCALRATPLSAQLIQIKTLPIADGDQWRFFPSATSGSAASRSRFADSLLDPFENPAKGVAD